MCYSCPSLHPPIFSSLISILSRTAERCIEVIRNSKNITTLDITGGAPELNKEFKYLVTEARKMGVQVIDR